MDGDEKMGVFVAGVPSSLVCRTPFFSRSPSPFTPATQAKCVQVKAAYSLLETKNSKKEVEEAEVKDL